MRNLLFYKLIILIIFTLPIKNAEGQNRRLARADAAFELRQYSEAVELYQRVYRRVNRDDRSEGARIMFNIGISYKYMGETRRAETSFRRAIRGRYPDPIAIYYFAEALFQNEKYDDALEQFKLYAEKVPDDWRGPIGIQSVKMAMEMQDESSIYELDMNRNFNSRNNDFAPTFGDGRGSMLIWTSSRDDSFGDKTDPSTGQNFTSLFVSYLNRQGEWSNPSLLDEGPINTEFNEGAASANSSGTELYFTRCQAKPDIDFGCRIYMSQREGVNWGDPREVVLISDSTVTVGQPAISNDDMRLYFVSDMPGGHGGLDIWVAERESPTGDFKHPRNLGPKINTPGDEMFPYIKEDGTLYFSSNGHPGLGGLDIFSSKPDGNSWSEPQNIGLPFNSSGDDYGITFRGSDDFGFFSSNRNWRGTRGDAVFSFYLPPLEFTLAGTVRDDSTKRVLPGVQIQLIGSDGSFVQEETSEEGTYFFGKTRINEDTAYEILVSKEGYFNARGNETTRGISRSRDFVYDFYIAPIPDKPIELPDILYEFASWELLPQYQDSLSGLVETLTDNPNLIIELASHTDSRGSHEINDTLSQRRAQTVVNFLVEKGIDPSRLQAKGYGKRVPRVIVNPITREGYTFEGGTEITEEFIRTLPTETKRDAAHQLNRRTEFRVIGDDFEPDE